MLKHKNSRTRNTIIVAAVAAVLVAGGLVWYFTRDDETQKTTQATATNKPVNTIDYTPATPDDNKSVEDNKSNNAADTLNKPTIPPDYSVRVTRASIDNDGKQLIVGTLVSGTTSGSCTLEATRSGQTTVTTSSSIALQNNVYSCSNFLIPFSDFPVPGDWTVKVTVTSGDNKVTDQWPQNVTIPSKQ